MIRVIQGKEHEEYIKFICSIMQLQEENNNIEFYFNENILNGFMIVKNNLTEIFLSDNKDVKSSIIFMLQKYCFECVCQKENKNPVILELMSSYLANYYKYTLLIDYMDLIKLDSKKFIEQNIIECKTFIEKMCEEHNKSINKVSKMLSCINILKKYNCENYDNESIDNIFNFTDIFKDLNFSNVNEKYLEIEQAYNNLND